MKRLAVISLCLFLPLIARADQQIADAQQSLKDLGFYYGDVTGEKSKETNDAVRRYQIRNGLNITGELNDETIQALKKSAAAEAAATPEVTPTQEAPNRSAPQTQPSENENSEPEQSDQDQSRQPSQGPVQPFSPTRNFPPGGPAPMPVPNSAPPDGIYNGRPVPALRNDLFANTPYQAAPPEVQRKVITDAQRRLADVGLYKHPVDGNFTPDLEFSLRAYQSRVHLQPTGRLDLETLAALELLPGSRRHYRQPMQPALPPVRGEWIKP